jgi:hypothetical protein
MPQFDIVSFFPQVSFFSFIFIVLYIFISKNVLPKLSQNLKLSKRLIELYNNFGLKEFKDVNLLSYIYKPSHIISYLIYKESICLIYLNIFFNLVTKSYVSSLNWLNKTNKSNSKLQVKLLELDRLYLNILQDMYFSSTEISPTGKK